MNKTVKTLVLAIVLCTSCANNENDKMEQRMKVFVQTVSSDEFQGRMPCTEGETKTLPFLAGALKNAGFLPVFKDSYYQEVPLVKITTRTIGDVVIGLKHYSSPTEVAVSSQRPQADIVLKNTPLVFCGFGAVAPEYGWNDFASANIRGKIAVVFVNDPGLYLSGAYGAKPQNIAPDQPDFKGRELTIYGRWKYKFEEAARQGAAGILIIHDDLGAGYNWNVASRGAEMGNMFIDDPSLDSRCLLTGWIQQDIAQEIFSPLGYTIEELRDISSRKGFKSFDMKTKLSVKLHNEMEHSISNNVAGIYPGTEGLDGETAVLVAHWDHFGVVPSSKGVMVNGVVDSIYNGAVDNGVAMAWALEIGRKVASQRKHPKRSVIILFPTAEEQGLLGSTYYTLHPAVPMNKTVLCLGTDMLQPRGQMKDLMLIGYGYTPELDSIFKEAAEKQNRYITPDPNSHTGLFFRSDHYPFYAAEVPALWVMGCYDSRYHGKDWASATWRRFQDEIYHTPLDNYDPTWDWSGVIEEVNASYHVLTHYLNK